MFDAVRLRARLLHRRRVTPASDLLHLGAGRRRVPGWLNVDVWSSDYDVDVACGRLPWRDASFRAIVSQHVIEHLELEEELIPLLRELRRVIRPAGELWLSCPDLEKVCRGYVEDKSAALHDDRRRRMPDQGMRDGMPSQHFVNWLFHQGGEHRNLYDLELLSWALGEAGFASRERVDEKALLSRFPEFPIRNDDFQSLYVLARPDP
ncbi:MAG TPA: methyltransferase domain-containing protein [Thermoanaerobaculia bacterium]|nr:methyltransferase domain-containing protein [Thermoanaerobaculia bacterium]